MGGKLSNSESPLSEQHRTVDGSGLSGSVNGLNHRQHRHHHHHHHHHRLSQQTPPAGGSAGSGGVTSGGRSRTRSHGGLPHHRGHTSPSADGSPPGDHNGSPELERPRSRSLVTTGPAGSLPLHLFSFHGIKCPVCTKVVPPEDVECHLVMCFTKPRVIYNDDVLKEDKGECVICLDDLCQGDTIARLPCLCIYHKSCIDRWFKINRSCPEHPGD